MNGSGRWRWWWQWRAPWQADAWWVWIWRGHWWFIEGGEEGVCWLMLMHFICLWIFICFWTLWIKNAYAFLFAFTYLVICLLDIPIFMGNLSLRILHIGIIFFKYFEKYIRNLSLRIFLDVLKLNYANIVYFCYDLHLYTPGWAFSISTNYVSRTFNINDV